MFEVCPGAGLVGQPAVDDQVRQVLLDCLSRCLSLFLGDVVEQELDGHGLSLAPADEGDGRWPSVLVWLRGRVLEEGELEVVLGQ